MVEETAPQLHTDSNQLEKEAKEENELLDLVLSEPSIGDHTEEVAETQLCPLVQP